MPNTEVSIAEQAGLPFEARCEEALSLLKLRWELLQKLSTGNVQTAHAGAQRIATILANSGEVAHKLFEPTTAILQQKLIELDEKFYKSLWEVGIESTRKIYGSDATDFALKTMSPERTGN